MNFAAITRRIRRCESEVPAQLVLEYAIKEAVEAEREACAKLCNETARDYAVYRDHWGHRDGALACQNAILARSNA